MISVFIAGDVVPISRTYEYFINERTTDLFGEIIPLVKRCDYSIVNLEAPVVVNQNAKPIEKIGPSLKTTGETLEVLQQAGFCAVTLANNHLYDYGQAGVIDTIETATKLGIDYVGAGQDQTDAKKILFRKNNSKTIGFINVCEHEFSVANALHGGTNGIDPIDTAKDIAYARERADYVICITHGGIEYYQYPTPRMKRWYRHFIECGADAVVNHHQHCLSGYEIYNGKPIFYGLGNFNFDSFFKSDNKWNEGFAVVLELGDTISFQLVPYTQNSESVGLQLRNMDDFEKEVSALNKVITDDKLLQKEFNAYCKKQESGIIQTFLPNNRILKALYRRGYLHGLYDNKARVAIKNKLCCESHFELMSHYFELNTDLLK